MRKSLRRLEETIRIADVAKRTARENRHAPNMTCSEGNAKTVGRAIGQSFDAVCPEVVVLALFTVRDHGRTAGFELFDRVANCIDEERLENRIRAGAHAMNRLNERQRSRNAPHRLSGNSQVHRKMSASVQPLYFNELNLRKFICRG